MPTSARAWSCCSGEDAAGVDRFALERARRAARELERQAGAAVRGTARSGDAQAAGLLLAFAYPDRIARRRAGGEGRYTLTSGRGAAFAAPQSLARAEFIVAVDLDDARARGAHPARRTAHARGPRDALRRRAQPHADAWSGTRARRR